MLMLSHGFCSSGLFALSGYYYRILGTRRLMLIKGVLCVAPVVSLWFFLFCVVNMSAPPRINLLGEVIVLVSGVRSSLYHSIALSGIIFLSCAYRMYLYTVTNHGKRSESLNSMAVFKPISSLVILLHFIPTSVLILRRYFIFF